MGTLMLYILPIGIVIIEYVSRYDKFLYKLHRLNSSKQTLLGFELVQKRKEKFDTWYAYKYQNIEVQVHKKRYVYFNSNKSILLYKNKQFVCSYNDLSKKRKMELYNNYLYCKYPFLKYFKLYTSKNCRVNKNLENTLKNNNLL